MKRSNIESNRMNLEIVSQAQSINKKKSTNQVAIYPNKGTDGDETPYREEP